MSKQQSSSSETSVPSLSMAPLDGQQGASGETSAIEDDIPCLICNKNKADAPKLISWTQCDACDGWFHDVCVGIRVPLTNEEPYECPECVAEATAVLARRKEALARQQQEEEKMKELREKEIGRRQQSRLDRKALIVAQQKKVLEDITIAEAEVKRLQQQRESLNASLIAEYPNIESLPEREPDNRAQPCASGQQREEGDRLENDGRFELVQNPAPSPNQEVNMSRLFEQQARLVNRQYIAKLPEFDGSAEMWSLFKAQFETSTIEGGFTDNENMIRLRGSLKGAALKTVSALLTEPSNVCNAMNLLALKYGSTEVLVKAKLKSLASLGTVNENRPYSVRNFFEFIVNLRASLEAAGAEAYLQGPQLLDNLVDKLPPSMLRSWTKVKITQGRIDLKAFIEWLTPHYTIAVLQDEDIFQKTQRVHTHAEVNSDDMTCSCCMQGEHPLRECDKFKRLEGRARYIMARDGRWCYSCLASKHLRRNCTDKKTCGQDGCEDTHHPLLHNKKYHRKPEESYHHYETDTYYRSLPVKLFNGKKEVIVWALLDEGSGPTLLSRDVAQTLGITGPNQMTCLKWSDGKKPRKLQTMNVSVGVAGVKNKRSFRLNGCLAVAALDLPMPDEVHTLKAQYPHLSNVDIPDIPRSKPAILIGLQHAKLMLPEATREGPWDAPVASLTKLGWSIYGRTTPNAVEEITYSCHICECSEEEEGLDQLIKNFHTTEGFGVLPPKQNLTSRDDDKAMEILKRTFRIVNGRCEAGLLWKSPRPSLPVNRNMAYRRLQCFERKLDKEPTLKVAVRANIAENIEKGYWKPVGQKEMSQHQGPKWFLPVFAVQNPNKPGKVRLVYDAAAKYEGMSLNDNLLTGPDNLIPLQAVLLRFREHKVGISGDIKEMYHRILMREEDQYAQLLLWRDCKTGEEPRVYKLAVTSFGATCSPSTAQYAKNENAKRFKDTHPRAYLAITKSHYVDDFLDGGATEDQVVELAQRVAEIHAQGGFEIRNWVSNSRVVLATLAPSSTAIEVSMGDTKTEEKVLGLYWRTDTDCFCFKLSFARVDPDLISLKRMPTKREVLQVIMSPFDPLGFIAPIMLGAKVLMQDLWRCGCSWDERIPDELESAWRNWLEALTGVQREKIPRWYGTVAEARVQLHVMADASELAFAAVAYLRIESPSGIRISFVAAKTRVAPHKPLSIPRLELQGAVLASRLHQTITGELTIAIEKTMLWTDSQTVLGWLRSRRRRYTSFVATRIGEILETTALNRWRWVPSKLNVADDATKWNAMPMLSKRWFEGPEFLRGPENEWPKEKNQLIEPDEEQCAVQFHAMHHQEVGKYALVEADRFSSWTRLVHTVAYILRFVHIVESKLATHEFNRWRKSLHRGSPRTPSGVELEAAQVWLLKKAQAESYPDEIQTTTSEQKVHKSSSLRKFIPFVGADGLLRANTRLNAHSLLIDENTRRPIILHGGHPITRLIVESVHKQFHHCSRETVVNELRKTMWIPKIRNVVNKVIGACHQCTYERASARVPRMAALPIARLSPHLPPFTHTGVDYLGPFLVAVGRRREKRWIALFTCLTMRAIHLEVASSLDTSSCVMVCKNFMHRRGRPLHIYSDQGTNFKATNKEFIEMLAQVDWDTVASGTQAKNPTGRMTTWHFNPPASPHFGGSWERMVRTVKNTLNHVLKSHVPRDETFRAAVIEVESLVNSRPLYYTSGADITEPAITPNLLLRKSSQDPPQVNNFAQIDSRKQWVISQAISQEFWKAWVQNYVHTIAHRAKWYDESRPLEVGQLVLIMGDGVKRGEWKRAIVTSVHPSGDGRIRSATVKTSSGEYVRPVAKLAVICQEEAP